MDEQIDLAKLQRDAARLVETAQKAGADSCDCVVAHGQSLGVSVRDGKPESSERSETDLFSLRVFCGNRTAAVSASHLDNPEELARKAVAMARVSPEDPFAGLAPAERLASDWEEPEQLDDTFPDAARLTEMGLASERAGLSVDGVSKSMGASAGWSVTGFVLATSTGFAGNFVRSRYSVSAAMVAGEGTAMERDYDFRATVFLDDLPDPGEIGRVAGERAVRRQNPRQVKSGQFPIVFDKRIAGSLLANYMGAINGAAVARKTSFLRDKMEKPVASDAITILDDPARRRGLGSRPFDGEGMPMSALTIVEKGMLHHWLLDWAAARELGLESNGRAARSGSGTSPSTTNCHIAPSDMPADQLIGSMERGLLVTETIGHGVNMVTGDYSKGASGFWVENGEIAYPVAEITIAGNLIDMFSRMQPADDLEFRGTVNAPSLLVHGMTIGGK